MIKRTMQTSVLAGLLLLQPIQTRTDDVETLKTVGIIGGVVAAGCGLVAGINYLCTPSNQTLINNGYDVLSRVQSRYDSLTSYCQSRGYTLYENDLSHIAFSFIHGTIDGYKQSIRDALNEIIHARRNLQDRIRKLDRKGERCSIDYANMERVEGMLAQWEMILSRCLESVKNHTSYFELYAHFHEASRQYGEIVSIMDHYGSNRSYCAQYLREYVAVDGVSRRNPYPTISYIETLTDRMAKFERVIQRCSVSYDLLVHAAMLYKKLAEARSILLADDRYAHEIQERERARREEERMRIEKERLEAERQKAYAAQRQASAAERQTWELARQNDLLREQNRLERERNERHRYCKYNRCCCNAIEECPVIRIEVVR